MLQRVSVDPLHSMSSMCLKKGFSELTVLGQYSVLSQFPDQLSCFGQILGDLNFCRHGQLYTFILHFFLHKTIVMRSTLNTLLYIKNVRKGIRVGCRMLIIPGLRGNYGCENCGGFEANLGCLVISRPTWDAEYTLVSQ